MLNPAGPWNVSDTPGINVGLGYVASAFRSRGWEVVYLDEIRKENRGSRLIQEASARGPFDAVGIYLLTMLLPYVETSLQNLREAFPYATMLAGGPHPSSVPELTLKALPLLDAVVEGEVEGTMPELDRFLRKEIPADEVPGLWAKDGKGGVIRGPARRFPALDTNPMPAWDLLEPDLYFSEPGTHFQRHDRSIATVFTRGCPHQCTYCNTHLITGRRLRTRPIPVVLEELRFLKERYGVREILVMDDGLTINRRFILDLCSAIKRERLDLAFCCPYGVRVDTLDDEVLEAMEEAGFYHLSVGIESGTQSRLDAVGKRLSLSVVRERVQAIKRRTKMILSAQFILGFPGETVEEARRTISLACELPLDRANFYAMLLLPGTRLRQDAVKAGIIGPEEFESRSAVRPGQCYASYPPWRLHELLVEAHLRFYTAPRRLRSLLRSIRTPHQLLRILRRVAIIITGR